MCSASIHLTTLGLGPAPHKLLLTSRICRSNTWEEEVAGESEFATILGRMFKDAGKCQSSLSDELGRCGASSVSQCEMPQCKGYNLPDEISRSKEWRLCYLSRRTFYWQIRLDLSEKGGQDMRGLLLRERSQHFQELKKAKSCSNQSRENNTPLSAHWLHPLHRGGARSPLCPHQLLYILTYLTAVG